MNRRSFIKSIAGGLAAVSLAPYSLAGAHVSREINTGRPSRYRIHGNKKLGCSGFDFPDDPKIIESGRFMPSF